MYSCQALYHMIPQHWSLNILISFTMQLHDWFMIFKQYIMWSLNTENFHWGYWYQSPMNLHDWSMIFKQYIMWFFNIKKCHWGYWYQSPMHLHYWFMIIKQYIMWFLNIVIENTDINHQCIYTSVFENVGLRLIRLELWMAIWTWEEQASFGTKHCKQASRDWISKTPLWIVNFFYVK